MQAGLLQASIVVCVCVLPVCCSVTRSNQGEKGDVDGKCGRLNVVFVVVVKSTKSDVWVKSDVSLMFAGLAVPGDTMWRLLVDDLWW